MQLTGSRPDPDATVGVVVILHGGTEISQDPVPAWRGAVLRMIPFAWAVRAQAYRHRRALGGPVAVLRLRNTLYGWNGESASPLMDLRAALSQLAQWYPGRPVVLVGHSMGGRVALRAAVDPGVVAVAALASWIEPHDTVECRVGERFLLMHGEDDQRTDPQRSRRYAASLTERGARVALRLVAGETHGMLRHPLVWHRTVASFSADALVQVRRGAQVPQ